MVSVKFERVTKILGQSRAVDDLTLEIKPGELFFLLGPSGCGKTTALRLVAGFYIPDEGRIMFNERDQSKVPPHKRNTGMVFQNYALWPHMDVRNNVAYGLKMRRVSEEEKNKRVARALETVQMVAYAERMPNQLSGGEQQRVALARALINRPAIVLADEPTGNLDSKSSSIVLNMLRQSNKDLGQTVMMITHNPEAAEYGDRIVHMRDGQIVTPDEDPQWSPHHPAERCSPESA
jgi:iron(III) transport system ATP-binding protein